MKANVMRVRMMKTFLIAAVGLASMKPLNALRASRNDITPKTARIIMNRKRYCTSIVGIKLINSSPDAG